MTALEALLAREAGVERALALEVERLWSEEPSQDDDPHWQEVPC